MNKGTVLDLHRSLSRCFALALLCSFAYAGPMSMSGQFEVSPTGAATYTIPLSVPPGTAGIEPKLSLVYNSQAGNGLLGVGWSLSGLSVITRCPRTMAQDGVRGGINFDANDRFCLDGQRLMAVSGSYGADGTEYRTERESFSKVVSYGSAGSGPAWFKVWTKAGQILEYGNTADSRIEAQGKASVRVWALNKLSDTKGNYFTVTYNEDGDNGDYSPARIDYTGNAGITPNSSVQFVYEPRPDVVPVDVSGAMVKSNLRLKKITTSRSAANVSEYEFIHLLSANSNRSVLSRLKHCDANNACMLPLDANWTTGNGIATTATSRQLSSDGFGTPGTWTTTHVDANGDGLLDTIAVYGGPYGMWHYTALRNPDGTYQPTTTSLISSDGLSGYQKVVADINADGKADIIALYAGTSGLWQYTSLGNGDGSYQWATSLRLSADDFGASNAWTTTLADANGDGILDTIAVFGGPYGMWQYTALRNPDGSYQPATTSLISADGLTGYQKIVADVNADGKADIVALYSGSSGLWQYTSLGNGDGTYQWATGLRLAADDFGASNAWTTTLADANGDGILDTIAVFGGPYGMWQYTVLRTPDGSYQPATTSLISSDGLGGYQRTIADVNGDGKADLVALYSGSSGLWQYTALGNGDGTYKPAIPIRLSPDGFSAGWTLSLVDVNGDAKADTVAVFAGSSGLHQYSALVPDGLDACISSLVSGSQTLSASYRPATDSSVYTKGTQAVYPLRDLAVPLYVVSQMQNSNGLGGAVTTNYRYGEARTELGTGRSFLGFRWTETTNPATGLTTRVAYRHDWPYVGLPRLIQKFTTSGGNGGVLSAVSHTYGCLNPQLGSACAIDPGNRYFPYVSQSVESGWDISGAALPVVTTTNQFDQYGNATQVVVSTSDSFTKTTTNSYFNDTTNWLLGRLVRSEVTSATGASQAPPPPPPPNPTVTVTGGTVVYDGAYTIRTFTQSGTLVVSGGTLTADILLIGGGGGGGGRYYAGGGGAGGYLEQTGRAIAAGSYPVVIGAGGAPNSAGLDSDGSNGSDSTFDNCVAVGGGGGAYGAHGTSRPGKAGGSGGGAGDQASVSAGAGTATQADSCGATGYGFNGGNGGVQNYGGGGGGGGAGGAAGAGSRDTGGGGNGGPGRSSSITGASVTRAGGGGGGGGSSSGGNATGGGGVGSGASPAAAGAPNTGGGGGGGSGYGGPMDGAPGGSGVFIIRYLTNGTN